MKKDNNKNEAILRELFAHSSTEKAPKGFADRVMDRVAAEPLPEAAERWLPGGWWLWGSMGIALVSLVVMVFLLDFSFMGTIFDGLEIDGSRAALFFEKFGEGITVLFRNFRVTTISVIILITVVALVLADRLLRRRAGTAFHIL